jgi:hypothetical protein
MTKLHPTHLGNTSNCKLITPRIEEIHLEISSFWMQKKKLEVHVVAKICKNTIGGCRKQKYITSKLLSHQKMG